MTVQNFVRIAWTVFDEMKRPKMAIRTAIRNFWANFGYVSQIPVVLFSCHCAHRSTFGCRMTVHNEIVWTVFEKFEILFKGQEKKNVTIA